MRRTIGRGRRGIGREQKIEGFNEGGEGRVRRRRRRRISTSAILTAISLKARFFASFFFLAVPTVVTWRT